MPESRYTLGFLKEYVLMILCPQGLARGLAYRRLQYIFLKDQMNWNSKSFGVTYETSPVLT